MKANVLLLFLVLIACAPAPTATSTVTAVLPTATATLTPTRTLEPTATPEGFQTGEDGNVQVFENGKWVDLKAPEGIWGPVGGTSVVLVEDEEGNQEAFTQIELNGYQMPDGSTFVNIAKYNTGINKWIGTDFSFTRTTGEGLNYATRSNDFSKLDIGPRIDQFYSTVTLLGIKYEKGENLQIMVLYKNEVKVIRPEELVLYEYITPENHPNAILSAGDLDLSDMLQVVQFANESQSLGYSKISAVMSYVVATPGTTEEDCSEIGNIGMILKLLKCGVSRK